MANCIVLGYIGQSPLEEPFLFLGRLSTVLYFVYFFIFFIISCLDKFFVSLIKNQHSLIKYSISLSLIFAIMADLAKISSEDNVELSLFLPLMTLFPFTIKEKICQYSLFRQRLYNKITLKLLENSKTSAIISLYHKMLFNIRIYTEDFYFFISRYMNIHVLAIIISLIFSRLHLAGYLIVFCLLFLRIDFSTLSMLHFYKQNPERLKILYTINKRFMWSRTVRIAEEAASNPQVQAAATLVGGALAWKILDVYDTQVLVELSEKDRLAENQRNSENIAAENQRNSENVAAENQNHKEEMQMRQKELEEAKASRHDENQNHKEEMQMRQKELEQNDKK